MITKFDSLYAGHVDLDNIGYAGTPIDERSYDNAHLATVMGKTRAAALEQLERFAKEVMPAFR